jgi:hypothetical protein
MGGVRLRNLQGAVVAEQRNAEGPLHFPLPGGGMFSLFGSYCPVWKIQCDKIRKHDSTEFVLAVVNLEKKTFNLLPPKKPSWVEVDIEYESKGHRARRLKRRMPIF